MNDDLQDMKARLRRIEDLLKRDGSEGILGRVALAQAIDRVRRVIRGTDRSRAPGPEVKVLLERAELLAANSVR